MNMLVSATAVAAATSSTIADDAAATPHEVLVMELFPPAGPNAKLWNALTLDGNGQRWGVGAGRDGEIVSAFREDRSRKRPETGKFFWWQEDAPDAVRTAVRRAIAERGPPVAQAIAADPALAAIERHRAAWLEFDAAVDDLGARQDALPTHTSDHIFIPEVREEEGKLLATFGGVDGVETSYRELSPSEIEAWCATARTGAIPEGLKTLALYRVYTNKGIANCLQGALCEDMRRAAQRMLRKAKRQARSANVAAGIPAAEQRRNIASDEEAEALHALALVIPTTAEGTRAVIEYWCKHFKENLSDVTNDQDVGATMRLLTSLHAAVGMIATPFSA